MDIEQKRIVGRPFQKGQSGNPGGRPKSVADVRELARQHTADAIGTLVQAMTSAKAPWATRVRAAELLLERGHGRAPISFDPGVASVSLVAALKAISGEAGERELPVPTTH